MKAFGKLVQLCFTCSSAVGGTGIPDDIGDVTAGALLGAALASQEVPADGEPSQEGPAESQPSLV